MNPFLTPFFPFGRKEVNSPRSLARESDEKEDSRDDSSTGDGDEAMNEEPGADDDEEEEGEGEMIDDDETELRKEPRSRSRSPSRNESQPKQSQSQSQSQDDDDDDDGDDDQEGDDQEDEETKQNRQAHDKLDKLEKQMDELEAKLRQQPSEQRRVESLLDAKELSSEPYAATKLWRSVAGTVEECMKTLEMLDQVQAPGQDDVRQRRKALVNKVQNKLLPIGDTNMKNADKLRQKEDALREQQQKATATATTKDNSAKEQVGEEDSMEIDVTGNASKGVSGNVAGEARNMTKLHGSSIGNSTSSPQNFRENKQQKKGKQPQNQNQNRNQNQSKKQQTATGLREPQPQPQPKHFKPFDPFADKEMNVGLAPTATAADNSNSSNSNAVSEQTAIPSRPTSASSNSSNSGPNTETRLAEKRPEHRIREEEDAVLIDIALPAKWNPDYLDISTTPNGELSVDIGVDQYEPLEFQINKKSTEIDRATYSVSDDYSVLTVKIPRTKKRTPQKQAGQARTRNPHHHLTTPNTYGANNIGTRNMQNQNQRTRRQNAPNPFWFPTATTSNPSQMNPLWGW